MGKEFYHLCVGSESEVMFRIFEDYVQGINKMALAALRISTIILAFSLMSNHFHIIVFSSEPSEFIRIFRNSYNKWFNNKYHRKGALGDRMNEPRKLTTAKEIIDALNYVLKNPMHHNIVEYSAEYPFSSARYYFMEKQGQQSNGNYHIVTSSGEKSKLCSKRMHLPTKYRIDDSGMIAPEDFLDISRVESLYGSVRQFVYNMNKALTEEWNYLEPSGGVSAGGFSSVGSSTVGASAESSVSKYERIVSDNRARNRILRINDLKLCTELDTTIRIETGNTYTSLTNKQKMNYARYFWKKYGANKDQLARCLAIDKNMLADL